ncbi:MAG: hypothetical protein HYU69_11935 [Bacteroidetes bacterium]|nr:hypothetical protein [Bacteroidota bacterium]
MKKFPHQEFITDNYDVIKSFPPSDLLQKRILGFDELEEDWKHTTGEDEQELLSKLESLSHELMEDLEEQYEDHLENNDQEEEEQPEIAAEPIQEEPTPQPEPEIQEPEPEIQEDKSEPESEAPEPTDEEILAGLFAENKHLVLLSELKEKGFKAGLDSKRLLVGKFCLHRGKYDTCYKIVINQD